MSCLGAVATVNTVVHEITYVLTLMYSNDEEEVQSTSACSTPKGDATVTVEESQPAGAITSRLAGSSAMSQYLP